MLDVGCGPGVMVEYALDHDYEFVGLDISEEMIRECESRFDGQSGVGFVVGDVEDLEWEDATFDVVVAMGLVEYLHDDSMAIREMVRVLKPGGTLVVSFPNWWSPFRIWDRLLGRRMERVLDKLRRRTIRPPVSHTEYVERKARNSLESSGLHVTDTVYYNFKLFLFPFNRLLPGVNVAVSRIAERFCRGKLRFLGTGFIVKAKKQ